MNLKQAASSSHWDTCNTVISTIPLTSAQDPFGISLACHPAICAVSLLSIAARSESKLEIDLYSNDREGSPSTLIPDSRLVPVSLMRQILEELKNFTLPRLQTVRYQLHLSKCLSLMYFVYSPFN